MKRRSRTENIEVYLAEDEVEEILQIPINASFFAAI